jgi:catechol 2,3-dioxygenase-like lactoylglutathione lyase family enzyme
MTTSVSAVLFAKDARRVARFYTDVFGATVVAEDDHHAALDVGGFRLIVHQIPPHLARDIEIGNPPLRRESGAIRLDYPVGDLVKARIAAKQLGGQIDDLPPRWAGGDSHFFLGFDSEGNVFGVAVSG